MVQLTLECCIDIDYEFMMNEILTKKPTTPRCQNMIAALKLNILLEWKLVIISAASLKRFENKNNTYCCYYYLKSICVFNREKHVEQRRAARLP